MIYIIIVYSTSFSRFLKVDPAKGNVLASFQLSQGSIGINLKANKIYFVSNNELLISSDGNKTYNMIGVSETSQLDSILIKVDVDTNKLLTSSVWDIQNNNEISSSIEVDSDIVYQVGQKNDIYIFLKSHNLTSLELINQKVFLPSTLNQYPGHTTFTSSGIAGSKIVTHFPCYLDINWIFIFNKNSLSLMKIWPFIYSNNEAQAVKGWTLPYMFTYDF